MSRRPAVFNIDAGTPFVDALAAGLLLRHGSDPLALGAVTVLLPNRRACRALREAFLRRSAGRPMLLPRLTPLGDVEEEELALSGADLLELPPAIPELRRQVLLARMVRRRADMREPARAARLALELARMLDQVQTEGADFAALAGLVPSDYAAHWQITIDFLKIVTEAWPLVLAEEGAIDPMDRRNRLMALQAERWRVQPPSAPVYVAGTTGSIPATADLMRAVLGLPEGAVVLPGLDAGLEEAEWNAIDAEPTHPQHGLCRLLARLGLDRREVEPWPDGGAVAGCGPARLALLREALRPAATTEAWARAAAPDAAAAIGVTRIDAPGPQEEAGAIALAMRRTLEQPGRTAALVTPDRDLARRVATELARWGVAVNDSAGVPLAQTAPGAFLRLTARMLAPNAGPVLLLSALKHPLAAGGMPPGRFRGRVRRLERRVLRGPRPAPGLDGVLAALEREPDAAPLAEWLAEVAAAAAPLAAALAGPPLPPLDLLRHHLAFAEWLATGPDGAMLWAGEAGEAAAAFVDELTQALAGEDALPAACWPALLDALMAGRVVRPRFGLHPRLSIWGLLEARLQQADLLILGGLNEGTWPGDPGADPWLSRPMRARFGLPSPERRIGLAAHDFQQAAAAPEVMLTRSAKVEGSPTVPSRWLLRLEILLRQAGVDLHAPAAPLQTWQAALDRPGRVAPVPPPTPRPPVAARPRRLSVTQVETLIRDPYAVYARHVLRLRPLEPIDADPGALQRGILIHGALERFVAAGEPLGEDALRRLIEAGQAVFADSLERPGVRAFWWPRFLRIARWFVPFEAARRGDGWQPLASEVQGAITLPAPAGEFQLTATADRIDRSGGELAILDYKTGQPPSLPQVESGLAPQLPLEAAMAAAGGFEGLPALPVGELAYLRLSGGQVPGEFRRLDAVPGELAAAALAGLGRLVAAFDSAGTPYRSRLRPQFAGRVGPYDHLARVKEWSAGAEVEVEE